MELSFRTLDPTTLKIDIINLVKAEELQTWEVHEVADLQYLKHTGQWGEKGVILLTPDKENDVLRIEVRKFKKCTENVEDFEGYYLGRYCELMFVNFSDRFTSIVKE